MKIERVKCDGNFFFLARCKKESTIREEMDGRNTMDRGRGRTVAQDYGELKIFNFGLRRD